MVYHVSRNGQNYGPYTLEDLQRYVASGNVLPTDLAKSDEMPEWVPVAQLLGASMPQTAPAAVAPFAGTVPPYPSGVAAYPDPPNLHWALVLVIGIFTCGLFFIVWYLVQAAWMRKVNPRSNALFLYIALYRRCLRRRHSSHGTRDRQRASQPVPVGWAFAVTLISIVLIELAFFDMRRSMEQHFNGPEPIGLSLSGVMTFFFGGIYFQYHFTRINELKRQARYRGAAI